MKIRVLEEDGFFIPQFFSIKQDKWECISVTPSSNGHTSFGFGGTDYRESLEEATSICKAFAEYSKTQNIKVVYEEEI